MNQIICTGNSNLNKNEGYEKKDKNVFKFEFVFLIIISIFFVSYYIYFRYDLYTYEKLSKEIGQNYEITKIYSGNSDYNLEDLNYKTIYYENTSFEVIGRIEISKLNISYPILSDINNDALKLAPCRFAGPIPNKVR